MKKHNVIIKEWEVLTTLIELDYIQHKEDTIFQDAIKLINYINQ